MLSILVIGVSGPGCRSVPVMGPVDLTKPGWQVSHGQASWTPAKGKSPMAGELLVAWDSSGNGLVQFTKTPFPFVTARRDGAAWLIEWGGGARVRSGVGVPPSSVVWFQLPRVACGEEAGEPWHVKRGEGGALVLAQPRSGERLEVVWDR